MTKLDLRKFLIKLLYRGRLKKFLRTLDNQFVRDEFIAEKLNEIDPGQSILDAGCGSQRYRHSCRHLEYWSQDFGQYVTEAVNSFGLTGVSGTEGVYRYGKIDIIGDIWNIAVPDQSFDNVLCTEVLEHIPYPIDALKEFHRILKPKGALILTAPANCLRHMDPYYYYSGFSDRWFEKILKENGFVDIKIIPIGDYFRWIAVELFRVMRYKGLLAKCFCLMAFVYLYNVKKTEASVNTLCMGYHIHARRA